MLKNTRPHERCLPRPLRPRHAHHRNPPAGTLPRERYDSFVKLQLEISYLREAEKRAGWQDRRKGDRVAHRVFNKPS